MHKIMILPVCLGILLVGIVMIPGVFAETAFLVSHAQESYLRGCEETSQGCFIPSLKTIHVGDTVIWENYDTSPHNVVSGSPLGNVGLIFDSQMMEPNTSFSHTFDAVGTYDYFCMIHPWMEGTIEVLVDLDAAATAEAAENAANEAAKAEAEAQRKAEAAAADEAANAASQAALNASGGCGEGTVLVDGVCQLAPQESSDGCGEGTVLKGNICVLDKSSGGSISPLYIAGGAAAIGAAVIGIVFAYSRNSKTPKPAKQDLDDYESEYLARQGVESSPKPAETKPAKQDLEEYEEQYLARQGQRPNPKPAEPRQTSSFCNSCGKPLKLTAKFCGKCGTPRS
jgi:plastocyanin